jgi:hypothetical protein
VKQGSAYSTLLCGLSSISCEKSRGGALKGAHFLATCYPLSNQKGLPLAEVAGYAERGSNRRESWRCV